jgi:hypothetical protein
MVKEYYISKHVFPSIILRVQVCRGSRKRVEIYLYSLRGFLLPKIGWKLTLLYITCLKRTLKNKCTIYDIALTEIKLGTLIAISGTWNSLNLDTKLSQCLASLVFTFYCIEVLNIFTLILALHILLYPIYFHFKIYENPLFITCLYYC